MTQEAKSIPMGFGRCLTARATHEPSRVAPSRPLRVSVAIAWIVSTAYAIWLTVTL